MRLSEAIRLGSMLKPQAVGEFLTNGRTCAIGAALDAYGELALLVLEFDLSKESALIVALYDRWPVLGTGVRWGHEYNTVLGHILFLNDAHGWTRERIAQWVETIEREESGVRADGGGTDVDAARSRGSHHQAGDDRVKEFSSV